MTIVRAVDVGRCNTKYTSGTNDQGVARFALFPSETQPAETPRDAPSAAALTAQ